MRSGHRLVVLLVVQSLACGEPNSVPPDRANLGAPVIVDSGITLDSSAKLGQLRLVTQDPDGPVQVTCDGAFSGAAADSLVITRPFAELRFHRWLFTLCHATEGDSTITVSAAIDDEYAIDDIPAVDLPNLPSAIQSGEPSSWPVRVSDDWGLHEYWLAIAPGSYIDCTLHWARVGTWAGAGRTAIDTTLIVTFPTAGPYCVVIGTSDDVGRVVGYNYEVVVGQ
jgi:hypothetical protein